MLLINKIKRKLFKAFHPSLGEVWMLHRVTANRSSEKSLRDLEITPDFLETKILEYKQRGYRFVSIDEASEIIEDKKLSTAFNKFVCVTFDDGYRDNLTEAYPIMKKHNIPFVIYVTTDFIDNKSEMWWYPGQQLAMSKEELLQFDREPLCTIGAHTLSHPKLDELDIQNQQNEILQSKTILEEWLGHPIDHFSYPHGAHTQETKEIAIEAGFKTIAWAWGGEVRLKSKNEDIFRVWIKQKLEFF